MKKLLALLLLVAAPARGEYVEIGRAGVLRPTTSWIGGNARRGVWLDSNAGNAPKLHTGAGVSERILTDGGIPASTFGTVHLGASDAVSDRVTPLKWQPAESGEPPWSLHCVAHDNPFGSRKNQVCSWGWNINSAVAGKAQFQFTVEEFYRPNSDPGVVEYYIATNSEDGTKADRPFSIDLNTSSGVNAMVLRPTFLELQRPITNLPVWTMNLTEGTWNGSTGDHPGMSVTTTNLAPALKSNGAEVVVYDSSTQTMRFSQDNVPTRLMGSAIIGAPYFDGLTEAFSGYLDFQPGDLAPVAPAGRARVRYNAGAGKLQVSISEGAYADLH